MPAASTILLSPADNVAVANGKVEAGAVLPGGAAASQPIEPSHKVAIKPIATGEAVVKYAQAIGRATRDIAAGEHVHSHNLAFESGRLPVVPPGE
ncbi:MAG: UxaA family hydrolase, partial [Mesorhizobium sp.]